MAAFSVQLSCTLADVLAVPASRAKQVLRQVLQVQRLWRSWYPRFRQWSRHRTGGYSSQPPLSTTANWRLFICQGRTFTAIGTVTAVPIYERTVKYEWTFWVATFVCGLTVAINACFIVVQRRLPQHRRGRPHARPKAQRGGGSFAALRFGRLLKLSAFFWLLAMSQLLQAGTVQAYQNNLSDMIMVTRGRTTWVPSSLKGSQYDV